MSKRCPSKPGRRPRPSAARGEPQRAAAWQRRVFRNSFTRQGQSYTVKGWAFKIQFQGRRRTFSLAGRTRAEAAQEAQQLHAAIVSQGWEAATRLHLSRRQNGGGTTAPAGSAHLLTRELAYWEQRLIQRRYHEARLAADAEYSVRIEHDGAYSYFPLGSNDPRVAAVKAREIHSAIVATGWTAALDQFEREITLAIFWSDNPAAATYTTLFTFLSDPPATGLPPAAGDRLRKPLAVLEPDPTVHTCLRYWLDGQPGFACPAVYYTAEEALDALDHKRPALVLVNRVAPDATQQTECLRARWPGLPVFPYRLHEDSDQIFISISGVSAGYIFRRRQPTALFDPLRPAARARTLTAAEAGHHIRNYFQSFFGDHETASQPLEPVALTNREQEILNHISRGYLDKEIADLLNISIWTVHNHVKNIYDKLGVHNRTEAVLKCLQR
jgi:DNA-binding NarL/FixJ family response regulator